MTKKEKFETLLGAIIKKLSGSENLVPTGLEVIIERGDPTEVILRKAEQLKPDLSAFGRSNKSGLRALVLGSTAQVIVEHLDYDLLVAPAVKSAPSSQVG